MRRTLAACLCTAVLGFIGGYLSGFRAAVADYVTNNAQVIEQVAETMYETIKPADLTEEEVEQLPDEVRKHVKDIRAADSDEDADTDGRGFQ